MPVLWTLTALEQLGEIEDFIARDNPARAITFVAELKRHAETELTTNHQIGRMVPEIRRPDIRELIYRNYRIVYRIGEGEALILTIFEGHRLLRQDEICPALP